MNVEMANTTELPSSWAWPGLGEIGEVNLGKTPRKTQYTNGGGLKIVKFRDIVGDSIFWDENDKGFVVDSESVTTQLCQLDKGDVLVTASAHSSEHIGKKVVYVSTIPQRYNKVFFVGELLRIRVDEDCINPRMVYYYLSSHNGYKAIQDHVRGVHLIASEARKIPLPLPPLPEQHRIVAKIEELFTRLDAGVEALKKAKAQLKRYRQSVLKYAFEGKLTEQWREAHRHELEPASTLLARIKQERRQAAKGRHKELPPLDTSDLPQLPERWAWTRVGNIGEVTKLAGFEFTKYFKYKDSGPVRVVRGLNIGHGQFKASNFKYIDASISDALPRSQLHGGELLIAYVGTLGTAAILPRDGHRYHLGPNVGKVVMNDDLFDARFLLSFFISSAGQHLISTTSKAVTQSSLSMQQIRLMVVPTASLAEQHRIVEEIERRLSVADEIERTVDRSLTQAERLRRSILKRAFEGKLVPQDPNDEPAEKLLERIIEERAKQQATAQSTKVSKKRLATQEMKLM